MKRKTGDGPRRRILAAAVSLIARKGYAASSIRAIAAAAGVNIARINYYFGDKAGLLRSIIEEFSERYYRALQLSLAGGQRRTLRAGVLSNIRAIVGVYRADIEMAVAGARVLWMDIPEVHAAQIHMHKEHRADLNRWFSQMGLDTEDMALMAVARGIITNLDDAHFTTRFHQEFIISPATRGELLDKGLPEFGVEYDDAFYDRYCEYLTDLYVGGIEALSARTRKKSGSPGKRSRVREKP